MSTVTIPQKISKEMRAIIAQALYEIVHDPDFGLELSEKAKRRLRGALQSRKKTMPFRTIKARYN